MSQAANQLWHQVTGTAPDEAAKGMIIRFEMVAVQDEAKTDAEGRPCFEEQEFIEIRSPNDPLTIIHRAVTDTDKRTYPQAYRAWKAGAAEALSGTPLKEWAPIARSQAEYLAFRGIRSVEQFAEVSDDGCHQLGHGYPTLRNKAIAWLAKAKEGSQESKLVAELAQRDSRIRALEQQISDIAARQNEQDERPSMKKAKG